jgi:ligand-binding sensor domain-containing protein
MLKRLLFPIFLLLISHTLEAEFRTNVHSISRREGLSNGAVNTIAKDAEGYIWFGTWNGLNRYDGFNMITYLPGNNSFSIHNHVIRELYPGTNGSIWILTNKGVSLYDNVHDQFTSFFTQESEQLNYENDISLCHSDRYGTIVSVFGRGVFKYDSIGGQFLSIVFDEVTKTSSKSIKWVQWLKDRLYLISEKGELFIMSENRLQKAMALPLKGTLTSSITLQINNRPFLMITQRSGVALQVDVDATKVFQLSVPDDIITSFSISKSDDHLWAGTDKGRVYRFILFTHQFDLLYQP